MEKGKFIHESSPESRAQRIVGMFLFYVFIAGFVSGIFAIIFMYPPPASESWIGYHWPDLIICFGIFLGIFLAPASLFGLRYVIYENGVTLPVYFFYNLLIARKDREGRFVPYNLILGYERGLDDPVKNARNRDKDVITLFFWDPEKEKIRLGMFGQNARDIDVLEQNLLRSGVEKLPKTCSNCGNKLLGMDYLAGKCRKCGSEIFEMSRTESHSQESAR